MSESCSKESALVSILRKIDHGFFWRPVTVAAMPYFANSERERRLDLGQTPLAARSPARASRSVTVR
jgi:hypothetical protein